MDRAAGCSRDARRHTKTPERGGQWQQDRVVRRLLLPGRRAVRTRRAGWNGLRGRSRLRRPPPPPRGAPCARRPPSASGAGTHRTPQRCAGVRVAASHPTQANQRNSCSEASEASAAFLHRFVASLPQKRPTISHRKRVFFFSAASPVVIMVAENPRDFLFLEFQWFIIEPNRYKTAAGSPKTRVDPPYGVFLFSPSRLRRRTEK